MNGNRISEILNKIFHIFFLVGFGGIFFCILFYGFEDEKKGFSTRERVFVVVGFALLLIVFSAVYVFIQNYNPKSRIKRKKELTDKHINIVIFSIVGLMLILQVVAGYLIEMEPVTDMNYLNRYAFDFAKTGNYDLIQKDYENGSVYLVRYPNNLAITFLLSVIYRIGYLILGYIPTFSPVIVNAFAINVSVLFTVLLAKKIFGNRKALMVLFLCFIFAPYYTYVPYYYTDSLSMPFCVVSVYLFVCAIKSESKYKKYIMLAISGALMFIGFKLKGSVIILLAVAIIYIVLKFKLKQILCFTLALVAGFGSIGTVYTVGLNNSGIISEAQYEESQYPVTHWIMMGLKGSGHYNLADSNYTESFPTKQEKQDANIEEIKQRIEDFGFVGLTKHIVKKAVWTWEDGTYFISHHIQNPVRENFVHSFVLTDGENYLLFYIYSCGFQLFLIFMMLLSILKGCFNSKIDILTLFKGIVFAAFIFFIIWETRSRYLYNFTPIFILLSIDGLSFFTDGLSSIKMHIKPKQKI